MQNVPHGTIDSFAGYVSRESKPSLGISLLHRGDSACYCVADSKSHCRARIEVRAEPAKEITEYDAARLIAALLCKLSHYPFADLVVGQEMVEGELAMVNPPVCYSIKSNDPADAGRVGYVTIWCEEDMARDGDAETWESVPVGRLEILRLGWALLVWLNVNGASLLGAPKP